MQVRLAAPWLIAEFEQVHDVLGWTMFGGGIHQAHRVGWREVRDTDLGPDVDVHAWLRGQLAPELGLCDAPVFLTSRDISFFEQTDCLVDGTRVDVVATVGLSNGVDLDQPVGPRAQPHRPGTINVLCRVNCAMTLEARLELLSLVAQARTVAVMDASTRAGRRVTGTGTDCIVVASTIADAARLASPYAGQHTAIGRASVRAVHDAVQRGCDRWLRTTRWPQ